MTLPVLPNEPTALVAQAHSWLASLSADAPGITTARNGAAALDAMRAAAKRAAQGIEMEMAYAEAARLAERRLGQLLSEGRDTGSVARGVGTASVDASTLGDLGIARNLAADCSAFAALTDEQWDALVTEARAAEVFTRASLRRAADQYLAGIEQANARAADRTAQAKAELAKHAKASRDLADLISALTPDAVPVVPPEPDMTVTLAADYPADEPLDLPVIPGPSAAQIDGQGRALRRMMAVRNSLQEIAAEPPVEPGWWPQGYLMAVRSAMSEVVAAAYAIVAAHNDQATEPPTLRRVR